MKLLLVGFIALLVFFIFKRKKKTVTPFEKLRDEYVGVCVFSPNSPRRAELLDEMWQAAKTKNDWREMHDVLTSQELLPPNSKAVQISSSCMCFLPE